jgi:hypothetical protein
MSFGSVEFSMFIEKSEVKEEELEVYVSGRLGQPTVQLVNCSGICSRKGFEVFSFFIHITKMFCFKLVNVSVKLNDWNPAVGKSQ